MKHIDPSELQVGNIYGIYFRSLSHELSFRNELLFAKYKGVDLEWGSQDGMFEYTNGLVVKGFRNTGDTLTIGQVFEQYSVNEPFCGEETDVIFELTNDEILKHIVSEIL